MPAILIPTDGPTTSDIAKDAHHLDDIPKESPRANSSAIATRVWSFLQRQLLLEGKVSSEEELQQKLKDGIILCGLINSVRPKSIPKISHRQLSFLQMENLCNFLKACQDQFGIHEGDLFDIFDLYQGNDMRKVLRTLLLLEKHMQHERNQRNTAEGVLKGKIAPPPKPQHGNPIGKASMQATYGGNATPTTYMVQTTLGDVALEWQFVSEFFQAQLSQELVLDSAQPFEDGVLLCKLMNALKPNSIATIHTKASPFFRMENVQNFLKAAKEFGVPEAELFQTGDLMDGNGPESVMMTIIALARISGFQGSSSYSTSLRRMSTSNTNTHYSTTRSGGTQQNSQAQPSSLARMSLDDQTLARVVEHLSKRNLSTANSFSMHSSLSLNQYRPMARGTTGSKRLARPPSMAETTTEKKLAEEDLRGKKLKLVEGRNQVDYQIGNCIGRGHFGTVYKGLNLVNCEMVAIKRIKVDETNAKEAKFIMAEVDLLKSLSHPNIVRYQGFIQESGYLHIILEFVENGSLYHTLKQFGAFPENLVLYYVVGILHGLVYLHGRNVIHRDLKAANILTTKNGTVKLSDFGVSKEIAFDQKDTSVAGTPNWMPPEIIELQGATTAADIWSLGCTILELLTGKPPFADCHPMTVLFRIVEDDHPPIPEGISPEIYGFLMACFHKDPTERWTAKKLLHHPWVTNNHCMRQFVPPATPPVLAKPHPNVVKQQQRRLPAPPPLLPKNSKSSVMLAEEVSMQTAPHSLKEVEAEVQAQRVPSSANASPTKKQKVLKKKRKSSRCTIL